MLSQPPRHFFPLSFSYPVVVLMKKCDFKWNPYTHLRIALCKEFFIMQGTKEKSSNKYPFDYYIFIST